MSGRKESQFKVYKVDYETEWTINTAIVVALTIEQAEVMVVKDCQDKGLELFNIDAVRVDLSEIGIQDQIEISK